MCDAWLMHVIGFVKYETEQKAIWQRIQSFEILPRDLIAYIHTGKAGSV